MPSVISPSQPTTQSANPALSAHLALQAEYVRSPQKWAWDMVRFQPDTWQDQAMSDFVLKRYCAWSAGSGVGKSALIAILILYFLHTRPFSKVPCTAPTQHQLYDILWAEIAHWRRKSEILMKLFDWTQTKVAFRGHEEEWFAVARTSRPQPGKTVVEGLQGFHAENICFVVDEASGVEDSIFGSVDGALTTKGAHIIMASNPTRKSGYFYKSVFDPREAQLWATKIIDAETAKHVEPGSLLRIARKYGKQSDYWRVKVKGLPPEVESDALVSLEQMFSAHTRTQCDESAGKGKVVVACDPARYGNDDSVFYVRKGFRILARESVHGMDTMAVADMAHKLYKDFNADIVLIDEIGLGAGVLDRLKQLVPREHAWKVRGVHVGKEAEDDEEFYNLRAEIFWGLRTLIDKISIPFDTELLDEELTTIRYKWDTKDTRIKIIPKDEIKKMLGRSPNDADAFAISFSLLIPSLFSSANASAFFGIGARSDEFKGIRDEVSVQSQELADQARKESLKKWDFSDIGRISKQNGVVGSKRYSHLRLVQ